METETQRIARLRAWGSEPGFDYVCLNCGHTVRSVNEDGECKKCAR